MQLRMECRAMNAGEVSCAADISQMGLSSTERKFLDHLHTEGLRLPDAAQKTFDGIYVQPDFFYEPNVWVFCDGTPHDDSTVRADDEAKRQAIINAGG